MSDWWDKLKAWFADLGEFLFEFTKSVAFKFIRKYDSLALEIVAEVASKPGLTGTERKNLAVSLLMAKVPEMALYIADTAIQMAYVLYKERQMSKDSDGDGIPDYLDMCQGIGAPPGGCVTADGCPDSNCDGVAD